LSTPHRLQLIIFLYTLYIMDNFRIHAYNEILELNNSTKKFIESLPKSFLSLHFTKEELEIYSDNLQDSSTADATSSR
jgi:hypothetical protein